MSLVPGSFGYYSMKVFRLYEDYKNAYPETDDENFRLLCCGAFLFRGFCYDEEKIEEPMPMDWWGGRLVYKKYKPK